MIKEKLSRKNLKKGVRTVKTLIKVVAKVIIFALVIFSFPLALARWPSWNRKRLQAIKDMAEARRKNGEKILILIAAQHPLKKGKPGEEFQARLGKGEELAWMYQDSEVEIFVPGSIHVPDEISLSEAGVKFLKESSLPISLKIRGEDLIERYKGKGGVYCTGDECVTAANYFKDGGFGRLIYVCSPFQVSMAEIAFIHNGVYPEIVTVSCKEMFHNPVDQLFYSVIAAGIDPDAQGRFSPIAWLSRWQRMPR